MRMFDIMSPTKATGFGVISVEKEQWHSVLFRMLGKESTAIALHGYFLYKDDYIGLQKDFHRAIGRITMERRFSGSCAARERFLCF